MNRNKKRIRPARRIILNLILAAFFVWVMVSLVQPVDIGHKALYAEKSPQKRFELVRLEPGANRQEMTYTYNEGDLSLQSK